MKKWKKIEEEKWKTKDKMQILMIKLIIKVKMYRVNYKKNEEIRKIRFFAFVLQPT